MRIMLIDGDILLYRYAFVYSKDCPFSERVSYEVIKEEIVKYLLKLSKRLNCSHFVGALSSSKNFRYKIAKTRPYKGNRNSAKPERFLEVRSIFNELGFFEIEGLEADDVLSSLQKKYIKDEKVSTIICSTDKDFKQVEGFHYNWTTDSVKEITKEEAYTNLWLQVLTGDSTDNIEGVPKVGEATAIKTLSNSKPLVYHEVVLNTYIAHFGLSVGISKFNEMFQLVYLLNKDIELNNIIECTKLSEM